MQTRRAACKICTGLHSHLRPTRLLVSNLRKGCLQGVTHHRTFHRQLQKATDLIKTSVSPQQSSADTGWMEIGMGTSRSLMGILHSPSIRPNGLHMEPETRSGKHLRCAEMVAMTVHGMMIGFLLPEMGAGSTLLNMKMLAWSVQCLMGGNGTRLTGVISGPEPHIKVDTRRTGLA